MKKNKIVFYVCLAILIIAMITAVTLFVYELYENNWVFDSSFGKSIIVIIGLVLSMVKLITRSKPKRSLRFYENAFKEHIENAFSSYDQKSDRKALLKAIALFDEDQLLKAVDKLNALKKKCKRSDDYRAVLLFLGLSYSDLEMKDNAIEAYKELLSYDPAHSTAWSNLGVLYKSQGNYKEALKCYESSVTYNPNNAQAWNNIAHIHLSEKNWEKVIAPAERAISIKADMHQAETALTIAYFALDNKEKSKTYFDRAVMHGANAQNLQNHIINLARGNATLGNVDNVDERVLKANGFLQRDTAIPMVKIGLPAPDDGNKSRFGGMPVDKNAPTHQSGNPMKLLAAIWCSEVRGIPDFPEKGVLRFYVADNDIYGADFDDPTAQKDFKVLYDENESDFDSELKNDKSISESFPVRACLPLRLTPAMSSVTASDNRFENAVDNALKKAGFENGIEDIDSEDYDFIYSENSYGGHRIGGYPVFEQYDPKEEKEEFQKYDTLLLQIVSHTVADNKGREADLIMFGDCGGCQFFIPREKLRAKDFTDIMYWWDCG